MGGSSALVRPLRQTISASLSGEGLRISFPTAAGRFQFVPAQAATVVICFGDVTVSFPAPASPFRLAGIGGVETTVSFPSEGGRITFPHGPAAVGASGSASMLIDFFNEGGLTVTIPEPNVAFDLNMGNDSNMISVSQSMAVEVPMRGNLEVIMPEEMAGQVVAGRLRTPLLAGAKCIFTGSLLKAETVNGKVHLSHPPCQLTLQV